MKNASPKARWSGLALAALVVLPGLARVAAWTPPPPVSVQPAQVDVTIGSVRPIPPGTEVGARAAEGWTHLVFRSHPRVADEHQHQVSDLVKHMAGLLFTAMLARVEGPGPGRPAGPFRLTEVAVGTGTEVGGRYVVLSSATQMQLGADLGLVDRRVLSGGEEELAAMRCIARSPTMMLIDAPSFMLHEGRHVEAVVRYAVLVDPQSGRLETLVWALAKDRAEGAGLLGPVEWLRPDSVQECPLSVKPEEFLFGMPVSKQSFAMKRLPRGRRSITPRAGLQELLSAKAPLLPDAAREVETRLWEFVR